MNARRILLIIAIYALGVSGWVILGAASSLRSASTAAQLEAAVRSLGQLLVAKLRDLEERRR